jgi:cell division protein FtsL
LLVNKKEFDTYYQEEIETIIEREEKRRAKKKKKAKSSSKISAIIFATVGLALCIYILNGYSNITKMKLEIIELENQKYELERDREDLVAELEAIKNSVRIEENAKIKLGMDNPREEQLVYLSIEEFNENEEAESKISLTEQFKNVLNLVLGVFRGA